MILYRLTAARFRCLYCNHERKNEPVYNRSIDSNELRARMTCQKCAETTFRDEYAVLRAKEQLLPSSDW